MPLKSQAQMRLAYASAAGKAKDGMPKKVAKEMLSATSKKAKQNLPETASSRKVAVKRKSSS